MLLLLACRPHLIPFLSTPTPHSTLALALSPAKPPTLSIWPRGNLLPPLCCLLLLPGVPPPPGRVSSETLRGNAVGLLLPIGRQDNHEDEGEKRTEKKRRSISHYEK